MLHVSGSVDSLIKSGLSTMPNVLWLLFVSWRWFEGFGDQGSGRRHYLSPGLSVLDGHFHCHPQALPITACSVNVITNQGVTLGSQGRHGTYFPSGALQVYDSGLVGV